MDDTWVLVQKIFSFFIYRETGTLSTTPTKGLDPSGERGVVQTPTFLGVPWCPLGGVPRVVT